MKLFKIYFIASTLLISSMAKAAVITFDDVPGGGCLGSGSTVQSANFNFTLNSAGTAIVCDSTAQDRLASNGTNYLSAANTTGGVFSQSFTMSQAGGASFDLFSIDLAELFRNGDFAESANATRVNLVGNLLGGGTIAATMLLDGFNDGTALGFDFQTFILPSTFVNLTSVVLSGAGSSGFGGTTFNIFAIDNVNAVSPVAEPSIVALFAVGLLGLGFIPRRKVQL